MRDADTSHPDLDDAGSAPFWEAWLFVIVVVGLLLAALTYY